MTIFIVLAEKNGTYCTAAFESGERAMQVFKKCGVSISRIDTDNMRDGQAEQELYQELEIK